MNGDVAAKFKRRERRARKAKAVRAAIGGGENARRADIARWRRIRTAGITAFYRVNRCKWLMSRIWMMNGNVLPELTEQKTVGRTDFNGRWRTMGANGGVESVGGLAHRTEGAFHGLKTGGVGFADFNILGGLFGVIVTLYIMQVARILPDLQCSLLCEEIRQEANGNFFIIGIVSFIRVPQVPVTAFQLSVFNRWTAGVGQFTECVRLMTPDQTTVMHKSEVKFELKDAALHSTNVTVFRQVEFKAAGTYFVEVLVDDVMKLRYPVPLIVAPANQNPQASTGKPTA
jgi:hypothetical protein